jgi:hypothetical protein
MRRTVPGQFPLLHNIYNMYDFDIPGQGGNTGLQVSRTPGATIITRIAPGGPQQNQRWTLVSVSVQAYLALASSGAPSYPRIGGKLGRIIAGLITDPAQAPTPLPFVSVAQPLPLDSTLTSSLFDPKNDDAPPTFDGALFPGSLGANVTPDKLLAIQADISPPLPIGIVPGEPMSVGIWMMPSVLSSVVTGPSEVDFILAWASYTINYDDGL